MSSSPSSRSLLRARRALVAFGLALAALSTASSATASDRRFTYVYNTEVLPPGAMELEPWTTVRLMHDRFYLGIDNKLEFEVGVAKNVQTAFYLNMSSTTEDVDTPTGVSRQSEFEWQGVSWEWKFKLLDAVADPVGFGLYIEPGIGPKEGEIEAKVLLDKRMGDVYFAYNLVGEYEVDFGSATEVEHEFILENSLGVAYYVSPNVTVGIEVRDESKFEAGEGFVSSTLFGGPVASFGQNRWWAAMSVTPQLGSIVGEEEEGEGEAGESESAFDLRGHERMQARLLFGYQL
ncbi:MAG: DUF6662 family protein [Polyangiaceae bacterium]